MSAKSDEEKEKDEGYMSFGDRALAAMSGIFGISEAKAKEPEIDAITSATIPNVTSLLEREKPKKDDYLLFDGFSLTWYRNDKPLKSWKAMSGNADPKYQKKSNQGLSNYGPLPEGVWDVKQSQYQSMEDEKYDNYRAELRNKTANLLDVTNRSAGKFLNKAGIISGNKLINKKFGNWSGGYDSWGDYRIWLYPAKGTDAKNRSGLAIHGGATYGSDGCIDLATKVDEFMKMYRKYGKDMKLIVKYADDFPE